MHYLLKTIFSFILFLMLSVQSVFAYAVIKAENNAYIHNNKGLIYLDENYYFGAIKEFEIAISLLPDKQASAVFYSNLAKTYERMNYPELAQPYLEKALSLNCLYFDYYEKLADNYAVTGKVDEKIKYYSKNNDSAFSEIMKGILYIKKGEISAGIMILDDFCDKEPGLSVTVGVRNYINRITSKNSGSD